MKIVSACLAGVKCRWNGEAKPCQKVIALIERNEAIPVCPEFLGGLSIPRSPAEQKDGRVITQDGEDVTQQFEK
jgi:uncharacterized protein YbbK (DUF523 family)